MGISVPIGSEHYDMLKIISEKVGLGLKKTMEYLVSYYWQKEMQQCNVDTTEVKPIRQLIEELGKEYDLLPFDIASNSEPKQNVVAANSEFEIPSVIVHQEELHHYPPKSSPTSLPSADSFFSDITKKESSLYAESTSAQAQTSNQSDAISMDLATSPDDQDVIPKTTTPSPQNLAQNCLDCGCPKRPSAKYCYNCGSLL